ncbi:uroporphyrinogen decarboxylase [Actinomadura darangshiensis]|uniref:Uroporphyrinogen decarboxylase n=1 Tax=Actinomadura darangshiensis TaxID=705336 RepID=A0A4R5BRJ0_9ACTN|nr:uroporphyrinogen decarboxylase [Actinomadura darangshiensis]TDD89611.1 uroporphyrinogen decarboxylase [Actinomadura darangshiensis]
MSSYLETALGGNSARAPVWMMRQAGRYLPEYRAVKEKYDFWTMCRTPELAAEITLQPVRRFGMDAAILFSDIMTPLFDMGVQVDFTPAPVIADPVRTAADVRRLRVPEQDEIAPFVSAAIQLIRADSPVPLIGFAAAPLTLATYLVQGSGSKHFMEFRSWLRTDPALASELLGKLTEVTIRYLRAQVAAGAQAVQLFDSWAGLHDIASYREFGAPSAAAVLGALVRPEVPRGYFAVHAAHLMDAVADLPAEIIGVDWRTPLRVARTTCPTRVLQGNLDPAVLLAAPDVVRRETERVLRDGLGGPHIFNLGHGVDLHTPEAGVHAVLEAVRDFDRTAEAAHGAADGAVAPTPPAAPNEREVDAL